MNGVRCRHGGVPSNGQATRRSHGRARCFPTRMVGSRDARTARRPGRRSVYDLHRLRNGKKSSVFGATLVVGLPASELLLRRQPRVVLLERRDLGVIAVGTDVQGGEHEAPDLGRMAEGQARGGEGAEDEAHTSTAQPARSGEQRGYASGTSRTCGCVDFVPGAPPMTDGLGQHGRTSRSCLERDDAAWRATSGGPSGSRGPRTRWGRRRSSRGACLYDVSGGPDASVGCRTARHQAVCQPRMPAAMPDQGSWLRPHDGFINQNDGCAQDRDDFRVRVESREL